ncbi:hypothetical protein D915_004529 [Fasciola hepatica]|uniref:Uncharacterized protein n=1 Tax=Fasciola hepatica TaxID=6192 RepID=A0A4E0RA94_FASHE|nr:hypothetical protein D915_004529 [Fasciola hepatica]
MEEATFWSTDDIETKSGKTYGKVSASRLRVCGPKYPSTNFPDTLNDMAANRGQWWSFWSLPVESDLFYSLAHKCSGRSTLLSDKNTLDCSD